MLSVEKLENINKYKISMQNAKQELKVEDSKDLLDKKIPINILRKPVNNKPNDNLTMLDKQTQTDSD
jgi:hypothetical protein